MAFRIIADSSCDIFDIPGKPETIYFNTVPFVITVDGRDFTDDENLDVNELVNAMAASSKSHTSCPSPADWVREFGEKGDVVRIPGSLPHKMAKNAERVLVGIVNDKENIDEDR